MFCQLHTAQPMCVLLQEVALLRAILDATKTMLTRCFQKYYAVSDKSPTGILEGDMANPESPEPILKHAMELAGAVQLVSVSLPTKTNLLISCMIICRTHVHSGYCAQIHR